MQRFITAISSESREMRQGLIKTQIVIQSKCLRDACTVDCSAIAANILQIPGISHLLPAYHIERKTEAGRYDNGLHWPQHF